MRTIMPRIATAAAVLAAGGVLLAWTTFLVWLLSLAVPLHLILEVAATLAAAGGLLLAVAHVKTADRFAADHRFVDGSGLRSRDDLIADATGALR